MNINAMPMTFSDRSNFDIYGIIARLFLDKHTCREAFHFCCTPDIVGLVCMKTRANCLCEPLSKP